MAVGRVAVASRVVRAGRVTTVRAQDPATVLGSRLMGLYEADACIVSGGLATTILDKSGTGNISTSAAGMTWNAASAAFSGRPTWSLNGSTSTFAVSSFLLGKNAGAIFTFFVVSINAFVSSAVLAGYGSQYTTRLSNVQKIQIVSGTRSGATSNLFSLNVPMTVVGFASEPVSPQLLGANSANFGDTVTVTTAPNASMAPSSTMQFGAAFGGTSNFLTAEIAAIVIGSGLAAGSDEAALIRWAQRKYGVAG